MERKKAIFISADPPMPPLGGGNRAFHVARALAEVTDASLFILFPVKKEKLPTSITESFRNIYLSKKEFGNKDVSKSSSYFKMLRYGLVPWSFSKKDIVLSAGYFINNPYQGSNRIMKFVYNWVKTVLAEYTFLLYKMGYPYPAKTLERYDQYWELRPAINESMSGAGLLWIDFSSLLPFFKNIRSANPKLTIVCNAHNVEYIYYERMAVIARNSLERKWYNVQAKAMKKAECQGFKICDLVITCSKTDKQIIQHDLPGARIEILPNGVDLEHFLPVNSAIPTADILFTGTMSYEPNRDAVNYFVEDILPVIKLDIPGIKFIIAGANASLVFPELNHNKAIEIISSPVDMKPIYERAKVVVVPLRSGSGTRLKIIEAMAMKKPVVTTKIGVEGIDVFDGVDIMIGHDKNDFAEKVVRLLKDEQLAANMAEKALDLVKTKYDWKEIRYKATELIGGI